MVGILLHDFKEGLEKAIENGDSLIQASKILLTAGEYSYSIYLAYHGIEEYGKALLFLQDIKNGKKEISKSRWFNVYCSHKKKLTEVRQAINIKVYEINTMYEIIDGKKTLIKDIIDKIVNDALKQKTRNIYVDWDFSSYKWKSPLTIGHAQFPMLRAGSAQSVLVTAKNAKKALDIIKQENALV